MDGNAKQGFRSPEQSDVSRQQLELYLYDPQYLDDLLEFTLPPEQHRFTALPAEVLSISLRDPERHPIVMVVNGRAVGFFVLHEGDGIITYQSYTDTPPDQLMLLRALLVDSSEQGHGYSKQAMNRLGELVRNQFPHIREVILAVNELNERACQVYLATGFEDRDIRRQGALGLQRILHYLI
ncbi:GNAT family N-acetyltransferase [Paenibacillus sp. WLX1005]|uniref:GNAT family N-acetyltransferase n=1 Tax=unclassified Paenibacillus TaxID=185978 RepID=UPI00398414E4